MPEDSAVLHLPEVILDDDGTFYLQTRPISLEERQHSARAIKALFREKCLFRIR